LQLDSPNPETTRAAAAALARVLDAGGLVLALVGPLGAGKTLFVKGLAEGLGIDPAVVTSPSFAIASEYTAPGGRRLAHVDLYRVESEGELEATGFLDLLEPGAVVAVEWADRLPGALPADRLELRLARPDAASAPSRRVIEAEAWGPVAEAALTRWRQASIGETG
jgi:tRNA threonylcarbamoyladenosine biosynthesis protein TsaE